MTRVKQPITSIETLRDCISYNAETGALTWRKDISKNVKAGTPAGGWKTRRSNKTGKTYKYLWITLKGDQLTGAQVAWALHYGEWPKGDLRFVDGNSENMRIDNIAAPMFGTEIVIREGKRKRVMSEEAIQHYNLKRYYGITVDRYKEMFEEQNGVCAVCRRPERAISNKTRRIRKLSVDHNHATGKVRGLLCADCNTAIGLLREDRDIFEQAALYLKEHEGN